VFLERRLAVAGERDRLAIKSVRLIHPSVLKREQRVAGETTLYAETYQGRVCSTKGYDMADLVRSCIVERGRRVLNRNNRRNRLTRCAAGGLDRVIQADGRAERGCRGKMKNR